MTPLAPFKESNLVFPWSSICSLQYTFLSISPGGPGRQKGCYPDLTLFKQGIANCKRTHMWCLSQGRLEYLIRHNWCMTLHCVNPSRSLPFNWKYNATLEFNFARRSLNLIWIPHENLSALQHFNPHRNPSALLGTFQCLSHEKNGKIVTHSKDCTWLCWRLVPELQSLHFNKQWLVREPRLVFT